MTIAIALDSVNGQPATQGQPAVLIVGSPNTFTVKLTNTGATLPLLTGGTPIAKGDSAEKPSSIYLEFPADTFGDIYSLDVTPPAGWSCRPFEQPSPMWALAPQQDGTWDAGAALTVAVAKVQVLSRNGPGILPVDVTRVAGLRGAGKSLPILTQTPGLKDLRDTIDFDFDSSNQVFISDDESRPLVNTLLFHISNTNPNRPVGTVSWPQNDPPTFSLTFATAEATDPDARGALTTAALADGIALSDPILYQDGWKRLDRPHGDLTWKMQPLTPEILGTEAASSVQFPITGITTFLPEGITWAYLTWGNVPGYADGYVARPLQKKTAIPQVQFGFVSQGIINAGDAVHLMWQSFAAAGLRLSFDMNRATNVLQTPRDFGLNEHDYSGVPPPTATTTYYLDVLDEAGKPIAICRPGPITITVNPYTARINAFSVQPEVAAVNTLVVATVTWDVTHARQIELVNPDINLDESPNPGVNTWSGPINGPTTFSLRVTDDTGTLQIGHAQVRGLQGFLQAANRKFLHNFGDGRWTWITFHTDGGGVFEEDTNRLGDGGHHGITRRYPHGMSWTADAETVTCIIGGSGFPASLVLRLAEGPSLVTQDASKTVYGYRGVG